jgi:hypothetical protein
LQSIKIILQRPYSFFGTFQKAKTPRFHSCLCRGFGPIRVIFMFSGRFPRDEPTYSTDYHGIAVAVVAWCQLPHFAQIFRAHPLPARSRTLR